MPNQKHLDLFDEGVQAWNQWRVENPDVLPDLSGAALNGAAFSLANYIKKPLIGLVATSGLLFGVALNRPDIIRDDLIAWTNRNRDSLTWWLVVGTFILIAIVFVMCSVIAGFSRRNLVEVNLSNTDLSGVNLSESDLIRANLSGSNLSGANLIGADLTRASLIGTNLSFAKLTGANLNGADLSKTSGVTKEQIKRVKIDESTKLPF